MKPRPAFTLIELLVVIAIIALLVSILMPSLQKAKELAKNVVCASNQRSVVLAMVLYTEDHDDQYPYNTGGTENWDTLNWAMKIGRIADDPNLLPWEFNAPGVSFGRVQIEDGYRVCIEGYIDYNWISDREGHFKCPTVQSNVNQKAVYRGAWSRQFSSSNSVTPRRWEYTWEDPDRRPSKVCVKTTEIRKRAVVIGDCHLKPSNGIDSLPWYDTNFRTTRLMVRLGDVNMHGPWPFQPNFNAWGPPQDNRVDFYGHPGDRANLCMTDGSIESVRESDPEDWSIR